MKMQIENRIANNLRYAIDENINGRGPAVVAQDKNTVQHRITDVRVRKGVIQGRALNTGKWFTLAGYKRNGEVR